MEQALPGAYPSEAGGEHREVARSGLGVAAVKALELSDQAAEKAQQLTRRSRRRYRRVAKRQARKLERHIATASQRLQVAMPVDKRRPRGRRVVLFVVVVGGGLAAYLTRRSHQGPGRDEVAEEKLPDASGAALNEDERERSTTDIASL